MDLIEGLAVYQIPQNQCFKMMKHTFSDPASLHRSMDLMSTRQFEMHMLSVAVNFTLGCKLCSRFSHKFLLYLGKITAVENIVYKAIINVLSLQKLVQLVQQYQLLLPLVSTMFY